MQFRRIDSWGGEWADETLDDALATGVSLTRRRVLRTGIVGVTALVSGACGAVRRGNPIEDAPEADALPLEAFVARTRRLARALLAEDDPDEDAYLAAVAELLRRHAPERPWRMNPVGESGRAMNMLAWMPPVIVYDIRMSAGARIDLHDHRHYNGIIQCREGSLRCSNFDFVDDAGRRLDTRVEGVPPEGADFHIRRTVDTTLRPSDVAALQRDRDNIHEVVAGPEGCVLTDVFTHFRPEARSYGIEWDRQPLRAGGDVFRASWAS
ncbi:MAG: hypothetical protein AAFU73_04580 [Planctomycetota bacterium]